MSLTSNDTLKWKGSCLSLSLRVTQPGLEAYVDHGRAFIKKFVILEKGKHVRWACAAEEILQRLPGDVKNDIYKYACAADHDVVFDLDSHTLHGLPMTAMHLCRELRGYCLDMNNVTVRMTSKSTITDFHEFRALHEWAQVRTFYTSVVGRPGQQKPFHVLLSFNENSGASLADCRIDIKGLVAVLLRANRYSVFRFRRTPNGEDIEVQDEKATAKLGTLLQTIFLCLADALRNTLKRTHDQLPEMWIDGTGTLLGLRYKATSNEA